MKAVRFKITNFLTCVRSKCAKTDGKNYVRVSPPLFRHLLRETNYSCTGSDFSPFMKSTGSDFSPFMNYSTGSDFSPF